MNTIPTSSRSARGRALVLGGGGSAGNAWLIGVIAGLHEAGLDVTDADLTIGTSAGATAAAQIAAAPPPRLLADILTAPIPARFAGGARATASAVADQMRRTGRLIAEATDLADMRRRMGASALALEASSDDSVLARWRDTVAARLPSPHWPDRPIALTAVDAVTGEPVVFDRHGEVALVDAVAASCSSGFAYRIGARHYIDGGYRANAENADLAAGFDRVLVLAPFGGAARTPPHWQANLHAHVEELRAAGSTVEIVGPDDASRAAFGGNVMDPSTRPPAARAGAAQGRELAPALEFFRG